MRIDVRLLNNIVIFIKLILFAPISEATWKGGKKINLRIYKLLSLFDVERNKLKKSLSRCARVVFLRT